MFCPNCKSEYRSGFDTCADCGVALVESLPPENEIHPDADLVKVYETSDAALVPVVHSLLQEAGIEAMTKNEQVQDFFALGRLMGTGVVGPVQFYVLPEAEATARAVLRDLDENPPEIVESPDA
jgi:hypothetical protein